MSARTLLRVALLVVAGSLAAVHGAAAGETSKPAVSKGGRAGAPDPAPAAAAPEGTPAPPPVSAAPVARLENGILKFDPLTIQGRVPKPTSIYAGDRKRPPFTDLVPEESLLPRILESVEEEPF